MPLYKSKLHGKGSPPPAPEPVRLITTGPVLAVAIDVPSSLAASLSRSGRPVPPGIKGRGLIDTGATSTAVSASAVAQLGINPVGVATVGTAGGRHQQPLFPLKLTFESLGLTVEFGQLTGADLSGLDIIALVGRDILSRMLLVYDGPSAEYTLAF